MNIECLDKSLVAKTLNFHGIQLQKIFETEYPHFSSLKLDNHLHVNDYTKRQKQSNFQDRGKRFRLQQFICKHADKLFSKDIKSVGDEPVTSSKVLDSGHYPILPPFEWFLDVDKEFRLQRFFEYIKVGDVIAATIVSKTAQGIILKILYAECDEIRCVPDIGIKAFCPTSETIPAVDKGTSTTRAYLINDTVCCEILEVSIDTEKIICGMKGICCQPEDRDRLGLINSNNFPLVFRKFQEKRKDTSYSSILEKADSFYNPDFVENLMSYLGIPNELYSHFSYLKEKFPEKECAAELRQMQASKWSFRNVTEGIEHFKAHRYTEAFQCLNKALVIDPRNIEALVARGALYANSSNYEKAITDFESALRYNPTHQNAKKYLGDTLIAFGRTHEESGKLVEAVKAYEDCLALIPNNEEARNSLQFIKKKMQGPAKRDTDEVAADMKKVREINNTLSQLLSQTGEKSLLRELKKFKKKHARSSSSSSSSSDSSTDSSDDSSSSSSSSVSIKKKKRSKKENSLSPLSKRMAEMENIPAREVGFQPVNQSIVNYSAPVAPYPEVSHLVQPFRSVPENENEYESRVRKFLEETKRDDDYEEKVRKFLNETAKWKKKQKLKEEKNKKKKKKEKLKSRKKRSTKKKKKDEKRHKKHLGGSSEESNLLIPEKYLHMDNLKDLQELQSKLTAYYSKVEKSSKSKKKDKSKYKSEEPADKYDDEESDDKGQHSMDNRPPELYEEEEVVEEDKAAAYPIKFKMQVPMQNKVKKRSTEDPFWGDDKNVSEGEGNENVFKSEYKNATELRQLAPPDVEMMRPTDPAMAMDKLRGFHMKKVGSPTPRRDTVPSRSKSRSHSRDRGSRYRSRSTSRRRYRSSRSQSRSSSYRRRKYNRYSRSRSDSRGRSRSRSRSRSPYSRSRNYKSRGTYYKPRIQSYRGSSRGTWRPNFNRSRGYSPRYRGRRPYYRPSYRARDERDSRRRDRRSDSDDGWRDSSRERSVRKRSSSLDERRDTKVDRVLESQKESMDRPPPPPGVDEKEIAE